MTVELTGFDRLTASLKAMADPGQVTAGLRPAVNRAAAARLARAQQLTPRRDGGLVNSAAMKVDVQGTTIRVTIGFGAPYARRVHENPRAGRTGGVSPDGKHRYRKWARVGQWRYLQTALSEGQATFMDDVAEGVETWLKQQRRS